MKRPIWSTFEDKSCHERNRFSKSHFNFQFFIILSFCCLWCRSNKMFGDIERWLDDLTWTKWDFYFKYIASMIVLVSKLDYKNLLDLFSSPSRTLTLFPERSGVLLHKRNLDKDVWFFFLVKEDRKISITRLQFMQREVNINWQGELHCEESFRKQVRS